MAFYQNLISKLRREATYLNRDIRYATGIDKSFYGSSHGSRILVYHGICLDDHTRFNTIFLKLKTFESHLKFYKKYFNVITLDDLYQQKFSNDKFNVCITFDDGFANNYKYVLPLLEQYKLPATFFVTSIRSAGYDVLWNDFLSIVSKYGPAEIVFDKEIYKKGSYHHYISTQSGISLNEVLRYSGFCKKKEMMNTLYPLVPFKKNKAEADYWLQMTVDQIRKLSASPFATIGAHSRYHNDLARIPIDEATDDMLFTKQYLEEITQKPVNSLAFPYGNYTPQLATAAKGLGYQQLLATDFLYQTDKNDTAMRERFTVNPFITTPNQMHATITRKYEKHW